MNKPVLPNHDITIEQFKSLMTEIALSNLQGKAGYVPQKTVDMKLQYTMLNHMVNWHRGKLYHSAKSLESGIVERSHTSVHEMHLNPFTQPINTIRRYEKLPRINGIAEHYCYPMHYVRLETKRVHRLIGGLGIIAGSAALHCAEDFGDDWTPNDIDVWTFCEADYKRLERRFDRSLDGRKDESRWHIQYSMMKANLHAPRFDTLAELLADFDLSMCACYIDQNFENVRSLNLLTEYFIQNFHSPLKTILRLFKYDARLWYLPYSAMDKVSELDQKLKNRWLEAMEFCLDLSLLRRDGNHIIDVFRDYLVSLVMPDDDDDDDDDDYMSDDWQGYWS